MGKPLVFVAAAAMGLPFLVWASVTTGNLIWDCLKYAIPGVMT